MRRAAAALILQRAAAGRSTAHQWALARNMVWWCGMGVHAVGKVAIWLQWLMVAVGVLISPVFVPLVAGFIGWSRLHRFCTAAGGKCPGIYGRPSSAAANAWVTALHAHRTNIPLILILHCAQSKQLRWIYFENRGELGDDFQCRSG